MRLKRTSRNIKDLLKPILGIVILSFPPIHLWPKQITGQVQSQEPKVAWLEGNDEAMVKLWIQDLLTFWGHNYNSPSASLKQYDYYDSYLDAYFSMLCYYLFPLIILFAWCHKHSVVWTLKKYTSPPTLFFLYIVNYI